MTGHVETEQSVPIFYIVLDLRFLTSVKREMDARGSNIIVSVVAGKNADRSASD